MVMATILSIVVSYLTGGHDDGEHDRPVALDGVEDEELARGGRDRRDNIVEEGGGVVREELHHRRDLHRDDQSPDREEDSRTVDTKHHLIPRDEVRVEVRVGVRVRDEVRVECCRCRRWWLR